jgi:hypothetical protein
MDSKLENETYGELTDRVVQVFKKNIKPFCISNAERLTPVSLKTADEVGVLNDKRCKPFCMLAPLTNDKRCNINCVCGNNCQFGYDREYYENVLYDLVYERDSWLEGICYFIRTKYNKKIDDWMVEVIDLVFYDENPLK